MTTADDLTPVWQDAAGILSDAFHADTYRVIRMVEVQDGYNVIETPQEVESGRCALEPGGVQGREGISGGGVVTAVGSYKAELSDIDTVATETDTLEVNGRTFEIIKVWIGGEHDLFPVVALEEHS